MVVILFQLLLERRADSKEVNDSEGLISGYSEQQGLLIFFFVFRERVWEDFIDILVVDQLRLVLSVLNQIGCFKVR